MQDIPSSYVVYAEHPFGYNDNIRVIRVSSKAFLEEFVTTIAVGLKAVPFQHAPQCNALSHVWGPSGDTRTLVISVHPVSVRANLWDFP